MLLAGCSGLEQQMKNKKPARQTRAGFIQKTYCRYFLSAGAGAAGSAGLAASAAGAAGAVAGAAAGVAGFCSFFWHALKVTTATSAAIKNAYFFMTTFPL